MTLILIICVALAGVAFAILRGRGAWPRASQVFEQAERSDENGAQRGISWHRDNWLSRVLLTCSGAVPELINREECQADRTRYIAIGSLIVMTACMATTSATYALATVFKNALVAIPFGIFWGLNVGLLERFFVVTIRKTDRFSTQTLLVAFPRLLMAVATAAVVSAPLELRIFAPEIEERMALTAARSRSVYQKEAASGFSEIDRLEAEKASLATEVAAAARKRDEAHRAAIAEAEGLEGTMRQGFGRVYFEKKDYLEARALELDRVRKSNEARIKEIEARLVDKRAERDNAVATLVSARNKGTGILARLKALREIEADPEYGGTLSLAIRLVFFLFLMVETAPVLGKLLMRRAAYDALLEARDEATTSHAGAIAQAMRESFILDARHDADLAARARAFESEAFDDMLAAVRDSDEFACSQKENAASFLVRVKQRLAQFVRPIRGFGFDRA